ncbi:MAG: enoyl-CoA hydratase/isomerase family protein [Firmicutes bacterium]|nr:enoyl-CoA hydratase/isomerase family protein [Bacillota bacterium]
MSYTTLKLESDGTVATITLNRPEKRNAISAEMLEELPAALAELERSAVRVVLLTGAGKAFCAGMDLEMLRAIATQSPEAHLADSQRMARLFLTLYEFPRPTIAAVNGPAIAGGCGLATLCDFVLAVPEAQFGYTEVRIGFLPAIVSVFLRRQVGERVARDLLLTGRLLEAAEALRLGLINELVPAERLGDRARELASSLLVNSPTSVERTKALLRDLARKSLERELALAIRENAAIRTTPDFREGITAFLEKRKPVWRGPA